MVCLLLFKWMSDVDTSVSVILDTEEESLEVLVTQVQGKGLYYLASCLRSICICSIQRPQPEESAGINTDLMVSSVIKRV